MKTVFTYLAMALIPATIQAQPMANHGEFYYIGQTLQLLSADATGINAGAAGANMTWDFSGLSPAGPTYTEAFSDDTSSTFLTCNLLATLQDGSKVHIKQNSTDSYINGIESPTGIVSYYRGYLSSHRPMEYGTTLADTFYKTVPSTGEHGAGYWSIVGDGWGTLKLPSGTYENVVRVRKYIREVDSLGIEPTAPITNSFYTSYFWFDTGRHAPLLRIDSTTNSTSAQTVTIRYIASPAGVASLGGQPVSYSASLSENQLALRGRFDGTSPYDVVVYNIIGTEILKAQFSTSAGEYRIDINRAVPDGIYVVSVMQAGDPSSKNVLKVIKQ